MRFHIVCLLLCPSSIEADIAKTLLPQEYGNSWLIRLVLNILTYAGIILPGYFIITYLKKIRYDEQRREGCIPYVIKYFVFGDQPDKAETLEEGSSTPQTSVRVERSFAYNTFLLLFCFLGLQVSYLTWGFLQERLMTHKYTSPENLEGEEYKNSQFLIFYNRIVSVVIGLVTLKFLQQPRHLAPVYKYSYSSLSNVMSSWFQNEALKFVSFPTQVLCKASKVIPVMLMGKVISKKTYQTYEYATAIILSAGIALFLFSGHDESAEGSSKHASTSETTFSGILLMVGYLAFDSFTSNWQDELFQQYHMSSVQMMTGVNFFSCLFTLFSLLEQGTFFENFDFMRRYPAFTLHSSILSLSSATGQLFIYYTINQFGPVTFTIIMTVRMALSILLSCYYYGHAISLIGYLGVVLVFVSLFGKIYLGQRLKRAKARQQAQQSS